MLKIDKFFVMEFEVYFVNCVIIEVVKVIGYVKECCVVVEGIEIVE